MAEEKFEDHNFRGEALATIAQANKIIAEYGGQRITLRQLYYQFVSRDSSFPNTPRSYKNLGNVLSNARLAGLVDWDAIEDRGRQPTIWSDYSSIASAIESAIENFRLPRWEGQNERVELWVEKQALAGVLEPIAAKWHVTLMVNKGYSSQSAMYESANRINGYRHDTTVLYLGDHDPSGEDMVRDVEDRLRRFGCHDLEVEKIGLTWAQIQQYKPPPNPAKMSDSRAADYVAKYGNKSWEVDALPPKVLTRLIEDSIGMHCDLKVMKAVRDKESDDKQRLCDAMEEAGL